MLVGLGGGEVSFVAEPTTIHEPVLVALGRWFLRDLPRRWKGLIAVLATMVLGTGISVLKPWPMKIVVDNVLSNKPMPRGLANAVDWLPGAGDREVLLAWCLGGMLIIYLLTWVLGVASSLATITFGRGMVYDLAADLFGHLERLSLRFHRRNPIGDTIRRVTADSNCVATIVQDALLPVVSSTFSLVAMFAMMWRLDRALTLLALVVVPYMVLVFRRYSGPMLDRGYEQQEAEGQLYDVAEQTLSAIPVVQAFRREEQADRRFRAMTDAVVTANLATTRVQLWFRILMGLATAGGTAAILWVGATHVLDGRLTIGTILVFLSYLGSLYGPLQSLMYTSATIQDAAGSARRVFEILGTESEVRDPPGASTLTRVRGHLCFEHVDFGYEPERPVLRDVCLEARPGQTVAIVGPTGSGKSTLVGLVPRFFDPWQGRVTLDGHDLRSLRLRDLRAHVALVPQEPFLFPTSVAENIAYGRPGAGRAAVEAAAAAAGADGFIRRLPRGYDTVLGERGGTLSGGERQRLAIARALLIDAPVLILDEPTSALDGETEAEVMAALARLMAGRTTLIVAHRLSTIRRADRIVVLRDGRLVESGTHRDLLASGGLYRRLHELQFGPENGPVLV
jgi:ATP-binding cassette subfamily B protein/subfamily B ATP-binding cassette protein MsbA